MKIDNIVKFLPFEGVKTKKIVSNNSGNVILISIEKGNELTAHKSNTDASILILEGEAIFKINEEKHEMFQFKKDEIHAIEALSDLKLILIK